MGSAFFVAMRPPVMPGMSRRRVTMIQSDETGLRAARDRAYALAESGRFDNAHAVEQALAAEGWPNAGRALESDYARKSVNERCRSAKAH
jgi:hypothetical protein